MTERISREEAWERIEQEGGIHLNDELYAHLLMYAEGDTELQPSDDVPSEGFDRMLQQAKEIPAAPGHRRAPSLASRPQPPVSMEHTSEFGTELARDFSERWGPVARQWRQEHLGSPDPLTSLEEAEAWITKEAEMESQELAQYSRFEVDIPQAVAADFVKAWLTKKPEHREILAKHARVRGRRFDYLSYIRSDGSGGSVLVGAVSGPLRDLMEQARELGRVSLVGDEAEWVAFILVGSDIYSFARTTVRSAFSAVSGHEFESYRVRIEVDPWVTLEELCTVYRRLKDSPDALPEEYKAKRPEARTLALRRFLSGEGRDLSWEARWKKWNDDKSQWRFKTLNSMKSSYSALRRRDRENEEMTSAGQVQRGYDQQV